MGKEDSKYKEILFFKMFGRKNFEDQIRNRSKHKRAAWRYLWPPEVALGLAFLFNLSANPARNLFFLLSCLSI